MSNGKISVFGGIVNVDPSIYKWKIVGTSCPTTLRREMGYVKTPFKFFPTKLDGKDSEDLVLMEYRYNETSNYCLFHIKRRAEDGYVRATENPSDAKDLVGAQVNFQVTATGSVELQVGKTRFTSDQGAVSASDETMMVADASDILKFIAGHIKTAELRAAATRAQKELGLQDAFKKMKFERDKAQVEGRQKDREIGRMNDELRLLRARLATLATTN